MIINWQKLLQPRIYRIASLGFATLITLVLWGYVPGDSGFSTSGSLAAAHWAGIVGAWIADFFYYFLGLSAWLLPVVLIYESLRSFVARQYSPLWVYLRVCGWLLLAAAMMMQITWWQGANGGICTGSTHALPCGGGGMLGLWLFSALPQGLNTLGAIGIQSTLWAIMLLAYSLITHFSWLRLADWLGEIVWRYTTPRTSDEGRLDPSISEDIDVPVDSEPELSSSELPDEVVEKPAPVLNKKAPKRKIALPGIDLLRTQEKFTEDTQEGERLQTHMKTVLDEFGVAAEVIDFSRGPVITHFEVQPSAGVKASRISSISTDLARSMRVGSVRVIEVSQGKSTVGIEIPNEQRSTINLRTLLESDVWEKSHSSLSLALGVDIFGSPVVVSLDTMPHLLIAGTTGSGKSVGVHSMLLSILYKALPESVRLVLIDPKMLELSIYAGIPHLLTPVITDMKDAISALRWCVVEMERRYKLLAALGVRDIKSYNDLVSSAAEGSISLGPAFESDNPEDEDEETGNPEPLPLIVVVIDEFADMMMVVGKQAEELIIRLAQKARAAGIHLILATQRPSVDVITGLIKANIPSRVAYQVSSKVDSRTVLDQNGAENLLGNGDMLYMRAGRNSLLRVHGAMVHEEEIHKVVNHYKRGDAEPDYLHSVLEPDEEELRSVLPQSAPSNGQGDQEDELYGEALNAVLESGRASASFIQRRFRIGYNRAARLLEEMEANGVVSAMNSNGAREILQPQHSEGE